MKRHAEFTEQAGRFRDYLPADDRQSLMRLVSEIAEEPNGPGTHLAYTNDDVTRSAWSGHLNVKYVVTWNAVIVVAADVYDAERVNVE
ncbi:hypothetical protein [Streptomyces sp. V1I1]|uniref:hypothetical protein n=1 Tax=Streptomyces sp. V1I1 TaxID=3042272 RepID=UPI00277F7356|nr:hypothetical protein [Streptomyces sp. V1I1]MDQ0940081.1 mRNA-degrading endonuclease RelE of RelBE toxin-antitoxin system [Streptomyces sp. V1I1]